MIPSDASCWNSYAPYHFFFTSLASGGWGGWVYGCNQIYALFFPSLLCMKFGNQDLLLNLKKERLQIWKRRGIDTFQLDSLLVKDRL